MNTSSLRRCAVKLTQKIGIYQFAVRIDTYFRNRKLAKAFHKEGLATLCIAHDIINQAGFQFFPTCGTFLGAYRNHDFIPYDCDLDAGVIIKDENTPAEIKKLMLNAGYAHTQQIYFKQTKKIVEDRFVRLGVQLDIFYYYPEEANYCCYFTFHHETKDWLSANNSDGFPAFKSYMPKCGFEKHDFLGHQILIPDDPQGWLGGIYGADFMTPIANWQFEESKTSTVNEGDRVYRNLDI